MATGTTAPAPGTTVLIVGGMTCAACVGRVEKRLAKLDGVSATVNLATGRARISHPPEVTPADLMAAVTRLGYTAELPRDRSGPAGSGRPDPAEVEQQRLLVTVWLSVPVLLMTMLPVLQFRNWQWLCFVLAAPVAVWGAAPFHLAAVRAPRRSVAALDALVSLAVVASFGWSAYALFLGGAGRPDTRVPFALAPPEDGRTAALYLAVTVGVPLAALSGRLLEERARGGAAQPPRGDAADSVPRLAERVARALVPVVLALATGTLGFWLGSGADAEEAIAAAVAVLAVGCPSALALAGPVALLAATDRAARLEVVLRDPVDLESLRDVDTVVLDGSGVLVDEPAPAAGGAGTSVRTGSFRAVDRLRRLGMEPVLVTGEDAEVARRTAADLGVTTVHSGCSAADRAELVRGLRSEGRRVAFVGDPRRDADALRAADLGIALGDTGTSNGAPNGTSNGASPRASTRADGPAHVTLPGGGIETVPDAVRLVRDAHAAIQTNLVWAFGHTVVTVPAAALGLLHPVVATAAMAVSTLLVAGNGMRLRAASPLSHGTRSRRPLTR
ncbi:heavy metal translocating P-type ATPase [Streptomyces sp. NPDC059578]|uniref:heavy metal translocating P-type ATPase n=1 Tax=Streptomyces sp. NPDC059578 TaxID=3346874 RepID=UPI0036A6E93F